MSLNTIWHRKATSSYKSSIHWMIYRWYCRAAAAGHVYKKGTDSYLKGKSDDQVENLTVITISKL